LVGPDAGHLQRLARGRRGHVAGGLVGRGDPASADAGPFADPSVAGVDPELLHEIVVGDLPGGEVGTGSDDPRALHALLLRKGADSIADARRVKTRRAARGDPPLAARPWGGPPRDAARRRPRPLKGR